MKRRNYLKGIFISAFSILGFALFYVIPFVVSIFQVRPEAVMAVTNSGSFSLAMVNTGKFFCIGIPLLFVVSLFVAISMEYIGRAGLRCYSFLLSINLLPLVIPSIVISYVMKIMFEEFGIVNGILVKLGLQPVGWMTTGASFILLTGIYVWKNYGYCMIIILSGLQNVPEETVEAAKLDGANSWTVLTKIKLKQIKSYLVFTILVAMMDIFKLFRDSYTLFGNYPNKAVYMIQNLMNNYIHSLNYSRVAVVSLFLILIISLIVILLLFGDGKWSRRRGDRQ